MRYLWILIAALLAYIGGGDTPLGIAAWTAPIFMLRFARGGRAWSSLLVTCLAMSLSSFFAHRGMSPVPTVVHAISTIVSGALLMLPVMLDRFARGRLPAALSCLCFPAAMVTLEYLGSLGGYGTWGNSAYALRDNLVLMQLASLTGVWGLGFLLYWPATLINTLWEGIASPGGEGFLRAWMSSLRRPAMRAALLPALAVYLLAAAFGLARLQFSIEDADALRAASIAPDASRLEAFEAEVMPLLATGDLSDADQGELRRIVRDHGRGMLEATARIVAEQPAASPLDLVLWSEASVLVFAADEAEYLQAARDLARADGIHLGVALGVLADDLAAAMAEGRPYLRNVLLLLAPDGEVLLRHEKELLVPGSETANSIPGASPPQVVETDLGSLSAAICFELDFANRMRVIGRGGCELMLVPANDWRAIKHSHAAMSRFRAVENGCVLLRATSRGISLACDPLGRTIVSADWFGRGAAAGSMIATLRPGRIWTLYPLWGDWLPKICALGTLLLTVLVILARIRRRA